MTMDLCNLAMFSSSSGCVPVLQLFDNHTEGSANQKDRKMKRQIRKKQRPGGNVDRSTCPKVTSDHSSAAAFFLLVANCN
mmetsp:Transcript_28710/g.39159  ORF Transcript_28710/g.39159 Transcript_28710/m.39159 type:complete len:80 (+) Transcript_28710:97-336(+)